MFGLSALATKLILGGILAASLLAGALYIKHVIADDAIKTQQLDAALATNKANLAAYKEAKDDMQAAADSVRQQHAVEIARLQNDAKIKQRIAAERSQPGQDAVVAPVLAHALDSLRNRPAANPSSGGANSNP
jgi:hypothetical protein